MSSADRTPSAPVPGADSRSRDGALRRPRRVPAAQRAPKTPPKYNSRAPVFSPPPKLLYTNLGACYSSWVSCNLVQRACPVCKGSSRGEFLQKQTLRLVRCGDCGMVFANPIEEGLASGLFYDRLAVPFYLSPDKVESDYSPVRFARELKLFRSFCPNGSVLDVGCSTGAFLFQLKTRFDGDY